MSKYRIGDIVYPVETGRESTTARCKSCMGEAKAYFKNGKAVDCGRCTDGNKKVSYLTYKAVTPIRIQGLREFTGIETKYYSEGEWFDDTFYGSMLKQLYFGFGEQKPTAKSYMESALFTSQREAEAFAAAKNRNSESEALDKYWKANDDEDESSY